MTTQKTRLLAAVSLLSALTQSAGAATGAENPTPGTIVTVAGTGPSGFSPDGVLATRSQLAGPIELALDAAGTLFFTDHFNQRVRKIAADGTLATVAGNGQAGFAGESGPARESALYNPTALTVDGAGNVYFGEFVNHRVRKVDSNGMMTTVAGSGPVGGDHGGFSGDGDLATKARLHGAAGLAVDAEGNLYIAELYNHRVRKVDPQGIITTVAGGGTRQARSADGRPATEADLSAPIDVAVDKDGNLYVAEGDANRVRMIDRQGIITTVAGTGGPGFTGDGGPATRARFRGVHQIAVDSAGNLFIVDRGNYRIRKVDPQGIITTVAGNGTPVYAGDGALATATGLRPSDLAVDAAGNLLFTDTDAYLGDSFNQPGERIFKIFGVAAPGLIAGLPFPKP